MIEDRRKRAENKREKLIYAKMNNKNDLIQRYNIFIENSKLVAAIINEIKVRTKKETMGRKDNKV